MTDININVQAHELDPSKSYIIEVRRGDLTFEGVEQFRKIVADRWGIDAILVVTETGESIKVKEAPKEGK